MKSKHLVIQIDIGQGTQWGNKETINPIREIFMPSVKKYCKKFDYDYVVINKSIYELKYKTFDFLETKNKHYSFERYFHFENDYDYTVYIDNDVYIYKDAKELPIIKGLMNAKESEGNSSKIFREVNNLDFDVAYYNSGVTFCDNATATTLSKYMINRLENRLISKGKNSDNMLLNEFILENRNLFNEIGTEWNYSPFLPNTNKIKNPQFFHFVGIIGKQIINLLQEKKINIEDFLNEIKN